MTGIRALERTAKSLPVKPAHVERRVFEYIIRHGTKVQIAAFDVATGQVRGTIGDISTEADFMSILERLFATALLTVPWKIVCDNLNTPMSDGLFACSHSTAASTTTSRDRENPVSSRQW